MEKWNELKSKRLNKQKFLMKEFVYLNDCVFANKMVLTEDGLFTYFKKKDFIYKYKEEIFEDFKNKVFDVNCTYFITENKISYLSSINEDEYLVVKTYDHNTKEYKEILKYKMDISKVMSKNQKRKIMHGSIEAIKNNEDLEKRIKTFVLKVKLKSVGENNAKSVVF